MIKLPRNKWSYFLIIASSCLMVGGIVGLANGYSVFYDPITERLQATRVNATLHVTIASVVATLLTPYAVKMTKKVKLNYMCIVGLVCFLVAGVGMGTTSSVLIMNLFSIIKGIGNTLCTGIIVSIVISNWFPNNFATIQGIVMSFSGIFGSLSATAIANCLETYGFVTTFIGCEVVKAILCIPYVLLCHLKPEEVGVEPFETKPSEKKEKQQIVSYNQRFLPNSLLFVSIVAIVLFYAYGYSAVAHLPSYAVTVGLGAKVGALLLSSAMMGNVAFKASLGFIVDRFGAFKTFLISGIVSLVGLAVIMFFRISTPVIVVAAFLYGGSYGVAAVCLPSVYRQIYSPDEFGEVYSSINRVTGIVSSFTLTIISFVYDKTGTYSYIFTAFLVLGTISMIMLVALEKSLKRANA